MISSRKVVIANQYIDPTYSTGNDKHASIHIDTQTSHAAATSTKDNEQNVTIVLVIPWSHHMAMWYFRIIQLFHRIMGIPIIITFLDGSFIRCHIIPAGRNMDV